MNQETFQSMELPAGISRAVADLGFAIPTEIQSKSIPLIRQGLDVIGRSQTGTGKTLAFGIPAVEVIDKSIPKHYAQVLILCPTRELALQAGAEIRKLTKYTESIGAAEIYGGAPMNRQIMQLRRASIVIGTPGRIMDHLRRRTLRLEQIKMVVLDEADEMLSMGFRDDIETILQDTPEERQTLLFSATMPPDILALTKQYQKNPVTISVNAAQVTVENIRQYYNAVPVGKKSEALELLLKVHKPNRAIIFVNTKRMADKLARRLMGAGFSAEGLHGDMRQSQRTAVMERFKHGGCALLVATDVAARGIDVSNVDFVINYDIPQNTEYYVHRIGRTGRAGKSGSAVTLCCGQADRRTMIELARLTKSAIEPLVMPEARELSRLQAETRLTEIEKTLKAGRFDHRELIEKLTLKGYSHADIAAAALQLFLGAAPASEDAGVIHGGRASLTKRENGGKIRLDIGKSQRVAANHIMGAMTEATSLQGGDIGKIEIFGDYSLVVVPPEQVEMIVNEMKDIKIKGQKVSVTQLSAGMAQRSRPAF